jgi:PKD repeat protein
MRPKYKKLFSAILPGIIVAGLIFGANLYYDLDLGKVIVNEITRIVGMFETTATTTLATLSGYVGIKTATPTEALTVSGNILATGNLTISGGQITGANAEQLLLGVTNDIVNVVRGGSTYIVCDSSGNCQSSIGGYIGGSGTSGYIPKFTGTYTIGNSIITDNGTLVTISGQLQTTGTTTLATTAGNVGIGTTGPNYKLTVNGDLYVSATSTLGSATSTPVIFGGYVQSNIIPYFDNQYTLGLSNYRWANIFAATGTFGGTITIGTNTIQGSATTTLFTNGNANQLVLGANGNVGIGTTAPVSLLELYKADASPILTITSATSTTYSPQIAFRTGTTPSTQFILGVDIGDLNKLKIATSSFPSTAILTINQSGYVGIGTTTPSELLHVAGNVRIGNWVAKYLSATELGFYDSGNNQVFVLDELGSPDIWEQTLTSQFEQGNFEYTTTSDDRVYLAKDSSGNYYPQGTFTSSIHNYSGIGDFIQFRATTKLSPSTKITAQIQVSDDNFSTVKDSIDLELVNDTYTYDISSLSDAKSVRVKFDFQTQNPSVSPELISFEVWANVDLPINEDGSTVRSQTSTNQTNSQPLFTISSFEEFIQKVKEALSSLGLYIENGIAKVKEIVAEKLTAEIVFSREIKTERITTNEIQMVDKATGEIYCTWIENGEWRKVKGECESLTSQPTTNNQQPASNETASNEPASNQATNNGAASNQPMVNFLNLPYSGKVGEEITFSATTSNFATDTLIFNWDFGDGVTTTTNSPSVTHTYNTTGTFTLTLTVTGGGQTASTSTQVEISINEPKNHSPSVEDITVTTTISTSVEITLKGSDPDGDPLTYTTTTSPTLGILSWKDSQTLIYTPNATGIDTFKYVASDSKSTSTEATVNINVE